MEPAGRKLQPGSSSSSKSSSTAVRMNRRVGGSGSGAPATAAAAVATAVNIRDVHRANHYSSSNSSYNNNDKYNNSYNRNNSSYSSSYSYQEPKDVDVDSDDQDYVHVPSNRSSTVTGFANRNTSTFRYAGSATTMAVQEEQRPPTLTLEEEDLYTISNRRSNSTGTITNRHGHTSCPPDKKRNVVSKMFFWKRNTGGATKGSASEERRPASTTGSTTGSSSTAPGTNYEPHGKLGLGDQDAVSIIALPPTSVISVASAPSHFHRRATMDNGSHITTGSNTHPDPSSRTTSKTTPITTTSSTTGSMSTASCPETNNKPVKVKPTKVSLSSLLQQPQKQGSSNPKSSTSVASLLTVPPTTIIDTDTSSKSNTFYPTNPKSTVSQQKYRNQLLHSATPPSKAASMINLSAGGHSRSMVRPPTSSSSTSRDPPSSTEIMTNRKATTVIGLSPPTARTSTSAVETLWRERQQASSSSSLLLSPAQQQQQKQKSPYHQDPPESPTPSQYSSKNSITTLSLHSSSTTAIHGKKINTTKTSTNKAPLLSSYQTNTPITKHYNISQQVLHAFELYYTSATAPPTTTKTNTNTTNTDNNNNNNRSIYEMDPQNDDEEDDNAFYVVTAYTIGVQYIETVLIEIPKHGYYYSKKHQKERLQSSINALHVGHLLLHLIEHNDINHNDPPVLPTASSPTKDKERNHIQNLIGIAMTHIEQVTNAVCGTNVSDTTKSTSIPSSTTNPRRDASASSGSTSSMSWLEQQYNNSVSILSLSTVCCGHDLVDPSPTAVTATTTNTTATMLSPTVVSSIIPILQGRSSSQQQEQEAKQRSSSSTISSKVTKQLVSSKPDPIPSLSVSSSSVFLSNDFDESDTTARNGRTPNRYVPRQNTHSSLNSHQSSTKTPEEALMLEKALFLSGLEVSSNHSNSKNHHHPDILDISTTSSRWGNSENRLSVSSGTMMMTDYSNRSTGNNVNEDPAIVPGSSSLELATLAQLYHEDFDSLQQSGRVRISYADTYQGRRNESTNGCTVIAPLVCIHHLINNSYFSSNPIHFKKNDKDKMRSSDPGLTDSEIVMIIDQEAPNVLSELRQSLGLAEHAFLIPADVHDYLLDQGQLSSSQFINVTGGNILNDEHLQAFISILEKASNQDGTQKIGATLFFHEHVLAICKLHRSDPTTGAATRSWYDIIDSLPNPATLRRCNESLTDVYHRIGMFNTVNVEECMMNHMIPKTARIRCLDVDALCAVLKWYACSKFTAENISYIDQYPWDEQTCDFDPRVFQAFIWGSCTDEV